MQFLHMPFFWQESHTGFPQIVQVSVAILPHTEQIEAMFI